MRIGIDLRPLESHSKERGIGYYNLNLFKEILNLPESGNFVLFTKFFSGLPKVFKNALFWKVPIILRPIRAVRKFDFVVWVFWNLALIIKKPRVLHITSLFEVYYLSVPKNIISIVTIYDLIPLIYEKTFFQNKKAKEWYLGRLKQAKSASKIIAISQSSKEDIRKILKIPSSKIEVIYCGVDKRFKKIGKSKAKRFLKSKYGIEKKYILSVGSTTINKNIPGIFKALKEYISKDQIKDLLLVVVCRLKPREQNEWIELIKKIGMDKNIILTNFVPDEDMPLFYSGAEVLLFPSLYEGFGLPIIEAMACGCPVITSNVSSMPEVGGKAAFYVNPKSIISIAGGIRKVLENKSLQADMRREGFKRAKKFHWEESAKKTMTLYESLISK